MRQYQIKRYVLLLMGIVIIGFGISIFLKAGLGIDPFTLMNMGISKTFNIKFSIVQWIVGGIILIGIFFIDKKKIFLGTVLNMFLIGPLIEGFSFAINRYTPEVESLWVNIVIVFIGCIVLCIGAGMYLAADLGLSPYDLIAIMISERKPIPFKWMRIITDAICVVIGWWLGSTIGIGTLIATFCTGPFIDFFKKKAEEYLEKSKPVPEEAVCINDTV